MATPSKENKELVSFNIQNVVYSIDHSAVKPAGYAVGISLQRNQETKDIYGDGKLQLSIVTDKSLSGNLDMTTRDNDFERDLGMLMKAESGGEVEVSVPKNIPIDIGAEVYIINKDGEKKVKRCWWFNVTVGGASDTYNQTTETINEANASYPITVAGTPLMASTGSVEYKDSNGLGRTAYKFSAMPGDAVYETFLDSVPVPKAE